MLKRINALKARRNLGQLLEEVYYRGDQYIIERAGKPFAAVVPLWQIEARKMRRERMFGAVEKVWRNTRNVKPEIIEREVDSLFERPEPSRAARRHDPGGARRQSLHQRHPERERYSGKDSSGLGRRAVPLGDLRGNPQRDRPRPALSEDRPAPQVV